MLDQFKLLLRFYLNPANAASGVLDRGHFLFIAIAAGILTLTLGGVSMASEAVELAHVMRQQKAAIAPQETEAERESIIVPQQQALTAAIEQRYVSVSFKGLVMMAVIFVPVVILLLAVWDHLGGGVTILFRDYMAMLACLLFAWCAAYLPVLVAWALLIPTSLRALALQGVGLLLFLFFATPCISTVCGVSRVHAGVSAVVGLLAMAGSSFLFAGSDRFLYMFASPYILFWGYRMFGRDVLALGGGLSARQNYKRQLEAATINPRDAEAHYQLGLVHLQRRSPEAAEACFRKALEIDREDPDTLFQLGRLLRESGRLDEAHELLDKGSRLNPRLANYEVWRELGAVQLAKGSAAEALANLAKYVEHREYDPEGLVLYGNALKSQQDLAGAKRAYEQAIEAVKTAPPYRRSQLRGWEQTARKELKGL